MTASFSQRSNAKLVEAEIHALAESIHATLSLTLTHFAENLIVFSDNKIALNILPGTITYNKS